MCIIIMMALWVIMLTSFMILGASAVDTIQGVNINIDCGAQKDYSAVLDLSWVTDAEYITTGAVASTPDLSKALVSTNPELSTLRYFDDSRSKNCYRIPVTPDFVYLVITSFHYGNYDNLSKAHSFDVAIDATIVAKVTPEMGSDALSFREFTIAAQGSVTYVCLLRDDSNTTPFISAIQVKHIQAHQDMEHFVFQNRYLRTRCRVNFGGTEDIRYPKDIYNRYWFPDSASSLDPNQTSPMSYMSSSSPITNLSTSDDVAQYDALNLSIPTEVFQTAVTTKGNMTLSFPFDNNISSGYLALYFAELANISTPRKMWIQVPSYNQDTNNTVRKNGSRRDFVDFPFLRSDTVVLYPDMTSSQHDPLLNGLEFWEIGDKGAYKTNDQEALVIDDIKSYMNLVEWSGDPCLPTPHPWLTCHGSGVNQSDISIIAVNLSGYHLNGTIPPSIGNLTNLTSLDLENNLLNGSLPNSLTSLKKLTKLFVQDNNLSGHVPTQLLSTIGLKFVYTPGNPLLTFEVPNTSNIGKIIGSIIGGIATILIIIMIMIMYKLWTQRTQIIKDTSKGGAKAYSIFEVVTATENFKKEIGRGGFGLVYYGKLADNQEVAVKVLDIKSQQGSKEFFNEVDLLSKVHHKNLVALVGYCEDNGKKMLIYEYVQEGSLRDHLKGDSIANPKALDWRTRLKIAFNAAQGIDYLHAGCNPSMVHRDVKTSNILLTEKFKSAKVSDFGLSRLLHEEDKTENASCIKGTLGYLDPEYCATKNISTKSDVFSFGVVLLELTTGRNAINQLLEDPTTMNLCEWVRASINGCDIESILDPMVRDSNPNSDALWKVIDIAMQCVEPKGVHRPSMSEVVNELRQAMTLEIGLSYQSRGGKELASSSEEVTIDPPFAR